MTAPLDSMEFLFTELRGPLGHRGESGTAVTDVMGVQGIRSLPPPRQLVGCGCPFPLQRGSSLPAAGTPMASRARVG